MTELQRIPVKTDGLEELIPMVTNTVHGESTKRGYKRELRNFFAWYRGCDKAQLHGFSRQAVYSYRDMMIAGGRGPVSINLALSAIRKLAGEATDNGLLDAGVAMRIVAIPQVPLRGQRLGNWLSLDQLRQVLLPPPITPSKRAQRDRVLLWILATSGLRRAEAASLKVSQIQIREGKPVFADVLGKGEKLRTVRIHELTYKLILEWIERAGLAADGYLLPAIRSTQEAGPISPKTARTVCVRYAKLVGFEFRPHDLRRTFATLARKGGADYEEIRQALGHSSIVTTERYLRPMLVMENSATDRIKI